MENVNETLTQPSSVVEKEVPQQDLVTRVANFKLEGDKQLTNSDEVTFDYKEIDKIADPSAKAFAEKAYKSMQSGFTKKFQEVADLRKSLESQANQKKVWTADTIQKELLSDPTFVAEAQRLAMTNPNPSNPTNSGMTEQEWSALTPVEKAQVQLVPQLKNELSNLKQELANKDSQAALQKQHEALKSKYANYQSDFVDTTVKEVFQGKKQITLEDVWKATDYENAVNRAYELGKADGSGKNILKKQSSSFDGGQTSISTPPVEPIKNESGVSYFKRIAAERLKQAVSLR